MMTCTFVAISELKQGMQVPMGEQAAFDNLVLHASGFRSA